MTRNNGKDRVNTDKSEDIRRIPLDDRELAERMERRAARREALHGGADSARAAATRSKKEAEPVQETATPDRRGAGSGGLTEERSSRRYIGGKAVRGEDCARETAPHRSGTAERPERGNAARVETDSYVRRDINERRRIPPAQPEQSARGTANAEDAGYRAAGSHKTTSQGSAAWERAEAETARGAKRTDGKEQGFFKRNAKPLLTVAMAVCVVLIIFSSYMFVSQLLEHKQNRDAYEAIENKYISIEENAADADKVYKTYDVDFDKLSDDLGSEISRWILFDYSDSVINYPIAYGTDNQFYVDHLADGTEGKSGAIFIDYRNESDFSNRNTIIYGHHMRDGSMFAELVKYAKQDYLNGHPSFYILTPDESYEAQIFSAFITPSDSDVFKIAFKDDSEFDSYLQYVCGLSKVVTGVQPETGDRIVTLVTCTYEYDDARFIVQAKLKPLSGGEDSQ